MTKGGNSKPTMLGRLIFGEKRKQHASPSRHRSATRTGKTGIDAGSSGGEHASKYPINVHDWAAWRTQLNEQMSHGATDQADLKQMRQFLQCDSFYRQHSRNPSSGRYNGVKLLFSIPHAKLKPDLIDASQRPVDQATPPEANILAEDRHATSASSVSPTTREKTVGQLLPKSLLGHTGGFLYTNEQMVAADGVLAHRAIRTPFTASDRVHSTLQKAVKDGNVLEKIKAFEMQAAAAAQADSTIKLGGTHGLNSRLPLAQTSLPPTSSHRALSPPMRHPLETSISPMRMPPDPAHAYMRSHRSRNIHPVQQRRDGNPVPMVTRESRKGAHVLEPAHGDIIMKRRTPSQKAANDDDYTITAMSSLAMPPTQPQHHQPHHRQPAHRTGASHSRHRSDAAHEKRSSNHRDSSHKRHPPKQKEVPVKAAPKTSTRHRWLKGRKESPSNVAVEKAKQDPASGKTKKDTKAKKKTSAQEKVESARKTTSPNAKGKIPSPSVSDNNRVYGVPSAVAAEQTKSETASPALPTRIEEENESEREEKHLDVHSYPNSPNVDKEEDEHPSSPDKAPDSSFVATVERRPSNAKYLKKVSSTDGEILSKMEDETRFSRPTDDHAHHSELNDPDEEYKSEGDVFIEDLSASNLTPDYPPSNQYPVDDPAFDRRWQWSKESGGLIDKGDRKKKPQSFLPLTLLTRKNRSNQDEDPIVYEAPHSEQLPASTKSAHPIKKTQSSYPLTSITASHAEPDSSKQVSKQILHAIMNSMHQGNTTPNQVDTDEFFERGPHTNPEETAIRVAPSS